MLTSCRRRAAGCLGRALRSPCSCADWPKRTGSRAAKSSLSHKPRLVRRTAEISTCANRCSRRCSRHGLCSAAGRTEALTRPPSLSSRAHARPPPCRAYLKGLAGRPSGVNLFPHHLDAHPCPPALDLGSSTPRPAAAAAASPCLPCLPSTSTTQPPSHQLGFLRCRTPPTTCARSRPRAMRRS